LGKKSLKKNRFNISSPLDVYKSEFVKNANLSLLTNIVERENLFIRGGDLSNTTTLVVPQTNNNVANLGTDNLVDLFLHNKKTNVLESGKVQIFKNDLLFLGFSDEKIFKTNVLKRTQLVGEKKNKPQLSTLGVDLIKT
jgi:hypothetical protein